MADIDYTLGLERGILGICLLEPTALLRTEQHLTSADFIDRKHSRLFEVMVDMRKRSAEMGPIGIGLELQRLGASAELTGEFLSGLIEDPVSLDPRSLDERVRRLQEEVSRRTLERSLTGSIAALKDRGVPLGDTLSLLRATANQAEAAQSRNELAPIVEVADEMLEQLDSGWPIGTPTCVPTLDWAIQGGIKPNQLVIMAGWTGSGKTSLATQIAVRVANWASKRLVERGWVLIFSYEMGREELVSRFVMQAAPLADGFRPPSGFSNRDKPKVRKALSVIRDLPIRIEDASERTVEAVRGATERFMVEHGAPALVIVDHIHLMTNPNIKNNKSSEIGSIADDLKGMAQQLHVPILALAQMNREVGKRDTHEPQLTDLKESGCITGDSRVLLLDTGEYVRIDSLVGKTGFRVLAIDTGSWKLEPREVTAAFSTGRKPVFRIETRTGRSIRATGNHKFLTLGGWKRLDQIRPEDRIATPRTTPPPTEVSGDGALFKAFMGRERAERIATVVESPRLAARATSDIYWDAVNGIEPDGVEDVYDLTVEGLHSFVADDIIVHNSLEQAANVVLMVHRPSAFYADPAQRALEEEKGAEAWVYVAKNRSGPTGKVRFDWIGPRYLFREDPEALTRLGSGAFEEFDLSVGAEPGPEDLVVSSLGLGPEPMGGDAPDHLTPELESAEPAGEAAEPASGPAAEPDDLFD